MKLHTRWLSLTLGGFAVALNLVSCADRDPGLVEKLALKEAELREKDARVQDLQQEIKRMAETTQSIQPKAPDVQAAKSNYSAFIEQLRDTLKTKLPDAKILRTSVFPIEEPNPDRPIVSKVAFEVKSANGNTGELTIPLYATASGEWHQSADFDVAALNAKLNAPPQIAKINPTPQPQAQPQPPAPAPPQPPKDVMGADQTVIIDFGDPVKTPSPNQPQQSPQTPPPPAAPPVATPPTLPKAVMPSDRDVIIDFD